jgi:translation initiation factor 2-alpha kinase 4
MARYHRNLSKPSTFLKKTSSTAEPTAGAWTIRRCDVLVAAFDPTVLRTNGLKVLADLWANDISSELAVDTRSPEEISSRYRDDKHGWVVILKQDSGAGIKADVKVKNLLSKQDSDVKWENLVPHLRAELREREHREGTAERNRLQQKQSSGDYSLAGERRQNVQVLMALHRSKKSNKWNIVEAAQSRAQSMLDDYANAPIAAVEIRDDILDAIKGARLSDPDSWRKVVHGAPLNERDYILDIHRLLERYKMQWGGDSEGRCRAAFIYNFRTGHVVLYDLGL